MKFFDFHVHTEFSEGVAKLEEVAEMASMLGYSGFCWVNYANKFSKVKELEEKAKKVSKQFGLAILVGFEAMNLKQLRKLVLERKRYDVLLVRGGSLELNRKAVETKEVDILTHPEMDRYDSGINHTMAKLARKNNVAIEFNFREVLVTSKLTRSKYLAFQAKNWKIVKRYGAPYVITSGAYSPWELKSPEVLISFGVLLGMDRKEAKEGLSSFQTSLIKMVKERRSKKWVMPGVKIE